MTDASYTESGFPAPAAGARRGWTTMRGLLDYIFTKFNSHWNNTTPSNQHTASVILANEASYLLTTARSITGTTLHTEQDMWRRELAAIWDDDYTPGTFATRWSSKVPITLLNTRNYLKRGLGAGDGLAVVGTDVPNVFGNSIPWRDVNGFVPMVMAGQSREMLREFAVLATAVSPDLTPNTTVLILAGRHKPPGALPLIWGGGTVALPGAHATLNRWDSVYVRRNESGTVVASYVQGTAASVPALPSDPPPGSRLCAYVYRPAASVTIYNYALVAGAAGPITGAQGYVFLMHDYGSGGTAPLDGSMSARALTEFAPLPTSPPSMSFTLAPAQGMVGGTLVNFAGATITYDGGGANPASPAAGTARWDGYTINGSGVLVITLGTPAASIGAATLPTLPSTNTLKQVCYVAAIGGMTAIYGYTSVLAGTSVVGQGWIQDTIRNNNTIVSTSSSTMTFANVVDDANSGTYADDFAVTAAPLTSSNFLSNLSFSGLTVTLVATTGNKVWAAISGRKRTNTASISNTYAAGGTSGWRFLIVDLSANAPGFTMSIHTVNDANPALYQAMAVPVWYNATAGTLGLDKGGLDSLDSTQVNLQRGQAAYKGPSGNLTNTSNYVAISAAAGTSTPNGGFYVPPGCTIEFLATVQGIVNFIAANPVNLGILMDGANTPLAGTIRSSTHISATGQWDCTILDEVNSGVEGGVLGTYGTVSPFIAPGFHYFTVGINTGAGGGSMNVHEMHLMVRIFRAPSAILG